jgi:hypothetical protein
MKAIARPTFPQRLKPDIDSAAFAVRVNSCPNTNHLTHGVFPQAVSSWPFKTASQQDSSASNKLEPSRARLIMSSHFATVRRTFVV